MKKMNKLTVAALALTAIALASTAASAQVVSPYEDLVLGFQVASGTGSSTNLEVDLGSNTLFTASTPTLTLGQLNVADLVSTYGSNWASVVNWSVAGATQINGVGTQTPAFDATSTTAIKTSSSLAAPYGQISQLTSGLNGQPSTANSTQAATIGTTSNPASGLPQSYTSLEGGNGYGFVPNAEQTGAGTDELYSFTQQAKSAGKSGTFPQAVDLGTFSLSSAGVLTFTGSAAAVPEPSAYALGICAALLFLVLRRRSTVA